MNEILVPNRIENDETATQRERQNGGLQSTLRDGIALGIVMLLFIVNGFAGSKYTQQLRTHTNLVEQSHTILSRLDQLDRQIQSAESLQLGFLVTGNGKYLEDYANLSANILSSAKELSSTVGMEHDLGDREATLEMLIATRQIEHRDAISSRQREGFDAARAIVEGQSGTKAIDAIHDSIQTIRSRELSSMAQRETMAASTYITSLIVGTVSTVAGLLLVLSVVYLLQHNRRRAERAAEWIRGEHARLQDSLDRIQKLETDNLQLNQYMRSFVEQVEDYAIFAMDENCRATTWNHGVKKVLGFEEADFIGQDIRKLIFVPEAIEMGIPEAEFDSAAKVGSASDVH